MTLYERVQMPSFVGDRVAQLRAARSPGLQDRVVLVNFWTLTHINWLRKEPYSARGRRPTAPTG